MFVENRTSSNPITMPPSATISEAAIEMGRHKFRHILVATPSAFGKKLIGHHSLLLLPGNSSWLDLHVHLSYSQVIDYGERAKQ